MTRRGTRGIVAAFLTAALVATSSAGAKPKVAATERVDVGPGGIQANGYSEVYSISAKGRYVAFTSYASNLLPGDLGPGGDVFVRDRKEGTTELVSPGIDGEWPNGTSFEPSLSANGRYVAFTSSASNLVPVDTGLYDLFVYDRKRQTTELITANSAGEPIGLYPFYCAISGNGRYVAFADEGSNLVPGDTNDKPDVFVHDRKTGTTERVSVSSSGAEGDGFAVKPEITHNGRFVTFFSSSTNLVPDDTNGTNDVFVHDRKTGETELVSVNSAGEQGNGGSYLPSISADGRFVAFGSDATNLAAVGDIGVRVFVHDRKTGETELASVNSAGQPAHGDYPSISDDGRFVAFHDTILGQVFVHDRAAGTTVPASVGLGGELANRLSWRPVISGDGHWVAFDSLATNLVPDDTNDEFDSFVRGPLR